MTNKMPDEIYVHTNKDIPTYLTSEYLYFTDKYISEQKHAEEIAALRAEHRALQEVHSDSLKFINFLQAEHRAEMAVLFDGFAVYSELDDKARSRTSADNVSDVLDAVVRLIKQRISDE